MRCRYFGVFLFCGLCLIVSAQESEVKQIPAIDNPFFEVSIERSQDWDGYKLTLINKTQDMIYILWDKTFYIDESNTTNGGFMFESDVKWEDKEAVKEPTAFFPNDSGYKIILPKNLATWSGKIPWRRGWSHEYVDAEKGGVLLTVRVGEKEIQKRVIMPAKQVKGLK